MNYFDLLKAQFNNRIDFKEKRPGVMQLYAPLYHEDGDMVDIFLESTNGNGNIRVCDHGMTLMRLSYSFDVDTPNKERIFNKILSENHVYEENGNLYIDANPESLYPAVLQFAQTVAKVSNMRLYKREVVESLFYEILEEIIEEKLRQFHPKPRGIFPLPERDDLEVDYAFDIQPHPVYLFGVKDAARARLATISCLSFQRALLKFKGFVVHEDFDSLSKKDRNRITSATDKQFVSLDDFRNNAVQVFEREAA